MIVCEDDNKYVKINQRESVPFYVKIFFYRNILGVFAVSENFAKVRF